MNSSLSKAPLMVLGTTSGSGKSLMTTALCRVLLRKGETPLPFKGQNMSNNAWVDVNGGEMAYSQALQAWAAGIEPSCHMNPVLLKPKGDSTSEVIHLGKSVGIAHAETYYQEWFTSGWESIKKGLKNIQENNQRGRLILEGAGSPVEVNLQHRDLTNLRLAKYLTANCLLVADIERGGVFAQLIGTLALLSPEERALIKGLLINRFRGNMSLFDNGRTWLEKETGIPVIGVMPWIQELFPAEDSLDLLERKSKKNNAETEIVAIKLPSISNFSDLDPLEAEPSVQLRWVLPGESLGKPDAVILPGSKQTIKDLRQLNSSGLGTQIKEFVDNGGVVFGICGGMQMLGEALFDPEDLEDAGHEETLTETIGLNLLPIHTVFNKEKTVRERKVNACWPDYTPMVGFELHHGKSIPISGSETALTPLMDDPTLGWVREKENQSIIAGTYLHGAFENGAWRRLWLNKLREKKGLKKLNVLKIHFQDKREYLIDKLADTFEQYVDLAPLLN